MDKIFSDWMNSYPEFKNGEIRCIMNDAIRCYKFDIPRPALMLSYIAFLFAVRQNVNNADAPIGYKDTEWTKIKKDLFKDRIWEESLLNIIKTQNKTQGVPGGGKKVVKAAVFDISDALRNEVEYWKNRRNDCAHYKDNQISLSHVASFWQFLMSNYHFFYPQGSIQTCIEAYKEFFDRSLTPEGADDTPIFKKLIAVIHCKQDIEEFFMGLAKLKQRFDRYRLINRLLHDTNESIFDYMKSFINDHEGLRETYLRLYDDDATVILGDNQKLIRKLWYKEYDNDTFCMLVKHNLIPAADLQEAIDRRVDIWIQQSMPYIDEKSRKILEHTNIMQVLIDKCFVSQKFKTGYAEINRRWQFYADVIKACPMDKYLVQRLVECFSQDNSPWILKSQICIKMNSGEMDKENYLHCLGGLGLADPFGLVIQNTDENHTDEP